MNKPAHPAIPALDVPAETGTGYPAPFREPVAARSKRRLGNHFALANFGVNLVELPPGCWSSQRHWHTHEDEFIYVLSGELTLITDAGEQMLGPGAVAGFPAAIENGHHLVNRGDTPATYLEVGDRHTLDEAFYPDIDMALRRDAAGKRVFCRRDGTPY